MAATGRETCGATEKLIEVSVDSEELAPECAAGAAAPLGCSSQPVVAVEGTKGERVLVWAAWRDCTAEQTRWLLRLVWLLVFGGAYLRLLVGWLLRLVLLFQGALVLPLPNLLDLDGVHYALRCERRSLRLVVVLLFRVLTVLNSVSGHTDASSTLTLTLLLCPFPPHLSLVHPSLHGLLVVFGVVHGGCLHAVHVVEVHLSVVFGHCARFVQSMFVAVWLIQGTITEITIRGNTGLKLLGDERRCSSVQEPRQGVPSQILTPSCGPATSGRGAGRHPPATPPMNCS